MTNTDKIARVKILLSGDTAATTEVVSVYLDMASDAIMRRLYPFGAPANSGVPSEYELLQCSLAARYFQRIGGGGEISHSENGISRHYGSVNDEDLLSVITPHGKVG